jgi:octaprenyl-diphosphate synthase
MLMQHTDILGQLRDVTAAAGAHALADQLGDLRTWLVADLREVERALADLDLADTPVHRSAGHLLALGGKRLRPVCVLLAARCGPERVGLDAQRLAMAVELVHGATLLHDDVVDLGEERRGAPAARLLYGNAASIFAGDWLLVEALARVRAANRLDMLDELLDVLRRMLDAEALQLVLRGRTDATMADYLRVVDGKTAALFRWALRAGGRAGGLPPAACDALGDFGQYLGLAFQIIDDTLDFTGDPRVVGKTLLADVREGKATWPWLVAVERDPGLAELLGREPGPTLAARVQATGALADARAEAERWSLLAVARLAQVPAGPARDLLESVAIEALGRVQ